MPAKPTVGLSDDFLDALLRLPKPAQKRTRELIIKFRANPTSSGLNVEPVHGAAPEMWSLRINKGYRAIVFRPRRGNLHIMLWADKHDQAYQWARTHKCEVNPTTGTIQVYHATQPSHQPPGRPEPTPPETGGEGDAEAWTVEEVFSFIDLSEEQLKQLGVPSDMLDEVQAVRREADLEAMTSRLPKEAYHNLYLYMAGDSYDKLLRDQEMPKGPVDTQDVEGALARPASRAHFVVAKDEDEMDAMLQEAYERWRIFLHPSQRRLAKMVSGGPMRVLGEAGTGKTVLAMHRARWLARNLVHDLLAPSTDGSVHKPVLFVTYSRHLAKDVERNLRLICTPDEISRIEVTNLDRWLVRFMGGSDPDFRPAYFDWRPGPQREAWLEAMRSRAKVSAFAPAFCEDEWKEVIQANALATLEDYLAMDRTGRGKALSPSDRRALWPVFEEYRRQLEARGLTDVGDARRKATALLNDGGREGLGYVAAVVDEAQDISPQSWRLIRSLIPSGPNDLFITGDGHQRIFRRSRVVLRNYGIEVAGRSHNLRLHYRTTEEIREWGRSFRKKHGADDLDGGLDDHQNVKSPLRGVKPRIENFKSAEAQGKFIAGYLWQLEALEEPLGRVCIVARIRRELDAVGSALSKAGVPHVSLVREHGGELGEGGIGGMGDAERQDGVRLATMHGVKGLEFDRVILASMNRGLVPLRVAIVAAGKAGEGETVETEERSLLYVAAMRARKELLVLSWGEPSPFLKPFGEGKEPDRGDLSESGQEDPGEGAQPGP